MFWLLLVPVVLTMLIWLELFYRKGIKGNARVELPLFFMLGFTGYCFLPMLEVCLKGVNDKSLETRFFLDMWIMIAALCFGAAVLKIVTGHKRIEGEAGAPDFMEGAGVVIGTLAASFIIIVLQILYIFLIFGGIRNYFSNQYGLFNAQNMNSVTAIFPVSAISYILIFNNSRVVKLKTWLRVLVCTLSVILIMIYLMGGNRNLGAMMGIAFVFAYFYGRKINVLYFVPVGAVGLIAMGLIAVGREFGMVNFIQGKANIDWNSSLNYILSVRKGEFGTLRNFYNYYSPGDYIPGFFPGFSYLISPFINMIPNILWPGRPVTLAVDFTHHYWQTHGNELGGLGFSPIVEAEMNFGVLWPVVFCVAGMLLFYVSQLYKGSYAKKYMLTGTISCVILNFFRIDFAVFFKFGVLVYIMAYVMYKCLQLCNRVK